MTPNQSIYQRNQGDSPFTKMFTIVISLIMVLLALLQLKCGNKSPFETHDSVMKLFIVTMLIYTLVAVATIKVEASWFTDHSLVAVLKLICFAFGFLACDLLLLILAPSFGHFVLVIWVLLLLVLLYYVLTLALHNPIRIYEKCMEQFCRLLHAKPQALAESPTVQTSVEQQDVSSEISNDMNV